MTDDGVINVILIVLLAGLAQVAGSFSIALTSPKQLPRWVKNGALRYCGGLALPEQMPLPKINLPCGKFVLALAWIFLLAIPYVVPLPASSSTKASKHSAPGTKLFDLARLDNVTFPIKDSFFVGQRQNVPHSFI